MTDTYTALREALAARTDLPWRADHRVGIVAVYSGPERNCLDGETFIHAVHGKRTEDGWEVPPQADVNADLIVAAVNAAPQLLADRDALHAEVERLRRIERAAHAYLEDGNGLPSAEWEAKATELAESLYAALASAPAAPHDHLLTRMYDAGRSEPAAPAPLDEDRPDTPEESRLIAETLAEYARLAPTEETK